MLNQVVMVGRIVQEPELKETEKGNVCNLTLAVPRNYKNNNGEYDTDFLNISLWRGIAENTVEYCKKGDLVGVKGRLETRKNDKNENVMNIIAEKITFLSSKKIDDNVDKDIKM